MREETIIYLDKGELEKIVLSTRFISDRQELPDVYIPGKGRFVENRTAFSRLDMYWVDLKLGGVDLGALCIDPDRQFAHRFSIGTNWCRLFGQDLAKVKAKVTRWFIEQPEFKRQIQWMQNIIDKGETGAGIFKLTRTKI